MDLSNLLGHLKTHLLLGHAAQRFVVIVVESFGKFY